MQSPDVEGTIERHVEYANFRGLRDFAQGDYLVDPDFHRGYALLEKYNLVYDLDVFWESMHKAAAMAAKFPNINLVVDHAGFPQERTAEYFYNWQKGIAEFRGMDNVYMKISGLGMGDHMAGRKWTLDTIKPWVECCLEVFGVERSFFGTNWPVDKDYSTYPADGRRLPRVDLGLQRIRADGALLRQRRESLPDLGSVVSGQWSVVSGQWSVVSGQWTVATLAN